MLHHSVSYDCNGLWHLLCFWLLACSICFSWIQTLPSFGKENLLFSTHLSRYMTAYGLTMCRVNPLMPVWSSLSEHCHTITTSDPLCFSVWKEDSGKYYTWRSFGPEDQRTQELWVDMSDIRHGQVRVHGILSNSYKQAVVSLTHKKYMHPSYFLCELFIKIPFLAVCQCMELCTHKLSLTSFEVA